MVDYKCHRVDSLPPTLYYIPDFISEAEEARLLDRVDRTPRARWTQLSNRRLQNWGGVPHPKVLLLFASYNQNSVYKKSQRIVKRKIPTAGRLFSLSEFDCRSY